MARRHNNMFLFLVSVFVVWRYTSSEGSRPLFHYYDHTKGLSHVFSDVVKESRPGPVQVHTDYSNLCFMRDEALVCRLDKLVSHFSAGFPDGLYTIISSSNANKVRLAIGDLSYAQSGAHIDQFLSSHSVWRVQDEPYEHLPKKEVVLESLPSSSILYKLYSTLDKHQFPLTCQSIRTEDFTKNNQFPAILTSLAYGLTVSLETASTYSVSVNTIETEVPEHCQRADWGCFFLPFTNCSHLDVPYKPVAERKAILKPSEVPEPFNTLLKNTGITNPNQWWYIQLLNYFARPNYPTRAKMSKFAQKVEGPCLTLALDASYLDKYGDMEKILQKVTFLLEMIEGETILLVTEEDSRPPLSGHPNVVHYSRNIENDVYWYLGLSKLVPHCGAYYGSFQSVFSSYMFLLMCSADDVCPLYQTFEGGEWQLIVPAF